MRTSLLTVALTALCLNLNAQVLVDEQNTHPISIYDILQEYKTRIAPYTGEKEKEKKGDGPLKDKIVNEEDGSYQYGRSMWYLKQHLDEHKNLLSPMKTYNEWLSYTGKINAIAKLSKTTSIDQSDWKFQGPDTSSRYYNDGTYFGYSSGVGRVNTVAFHPTDSNTIWVGTPSGGAWKTTNGGLSWTAMTDNLPVPSVGDIDFNPLNPNTMYLCTGDREHHWFYSIGVLKSRNGGATWDTTGLKWDPSQLRLTNCLVINPLDTNCVIVATSEGIYRSRNGGTTWTMVQAGNFKQVLYHPTDTAVMYAASYYNYKITSPATAQIFRSNNGGKTWTQVTSFSEAMRITLAVTPASVRTVKALVSSYNTGNFRGMDGIYNSNDTGKTFIKIYDGSSCYGNLLNWDFGGNGCGGQGEYDLAFAISPINANLVYLGGVNGWYSTDGGNAWNILDGWTYTSGYYINTLHADKHTLVFSPHNPRKLYECNDGGIFYTYNASTTGMWQNITNGLGITEFYSVATSNITPAVVGGAQDNGSKYVEGTGSWDLTGGDGMGCAQDFTDSNTIYTSYVYGTLYRIDNLSTSPNVSIISYPSLPTGAWLTPFVLQPSCNYCIVAGYQEVWYSNDQGNSWSTISPNLVPSGGTGQNLSVVAVTPADDNTVYAVPEDTNIISRTYDMSTWTNVPVPYAGIISDIKVDPKDKTHFWITYSGFTPVKVAEYKTSTGWKNISGSLPNVAINCMLIDTANKDKYIGTDVGVFYRSDTMSNWVLYNKHLPITRVSQLNINYSSSEIWAGTYGRGMWKSVKHDPTKDTAHIGYVSIVPFASNALVISPNPNHGNFEVKGINVADKAVVLKLIDNTGRVIWQAENAFDAAGKLQVNTNTVPRGTYILDVSSGSISIGRQKIVIN